MLHLYQTYALVASGMSICKGESIYFKDFLPCFTRGPTFAASCLLSCASGLFQNRGANGCDTVFSDLQKALVQITWGKRVQAGAHTEDLTRVFVSFEIHRTSLW